MMPGGHPLSYALRFGIVNSGRFKTKIQNDQRFDETLLLRTTNRCAAPSRSRFDEK